LGLRLFFGSCGEPLPTAGLDAIPHDKPRTQKAGLALQSRRMLCFLARFFGEPPSPVAHRLEKTPARAILSRRRGKSQYAATYFCLLIFALCLLPCFSFETHEKKGKRQKSKGKRQKWLSDPAFGFGSALRAHHSSLVTGFSRFAARQMQ
jgi:hypothetical protein